MTQRLPAVCAMAFALLLASQIGVMLYAAEPPIPPGVDPGGVAVAILGDGVDYTRPEIAARLARDGEGDLIARDFTDDDARPYAADNLTTVYAIALLKASRHVRLIIVKGGMDDPAAIGPMAAFAIKTPARIIFCLDAMQRQDWPVFKQAVSYFKDRLFIITHHGPQQPELSDIPNLIVTEDALAQNLPSQSLSDQAVIIISKAAELLAEKPELTMADLKVRLRTEMRPTP
ncbi:MAG: hypothetical protein AAFR90_10305 [Pseudomonadota bacterium]